MKARTQLNQATEAFNVIDFEAATDLGELEEDDRESMGLGKSLAQSGSGKDGAGKPLSKVQGLLAPEELRKQIQGALPSSGALSL